MPICATHAALTRQRWLVVTSGVAWLTAFACVFLVGWSIYELMCWVPIGRFFFLMGSAALVASVGLAVWSWGVKPVTGASLKQLFVGVWFPFALFVVPLGGPFFTLFAAFRLLWGKTAAASLRSTSAVGPGRVIDRVSSAAVGRSGVPAGLILLALAMAQPGLLAASLLAPRLNLAPKVLRWNGEEDLTCKRRAHYLGEGLELTGKLKLADQCNVQLRNCTITGTLWVGDDAELTIVGGSLRHQPTVFGGTLRLEMVEVDTPEGLLAEGGARLLITGGSVVAEEVGVRVRQSASAQLTGVTVKGTTGIVADNDATVVVDGGRVEALAVALLAEEQAVLLHRGLLWQGKVRRTGGGQVIALGPNDDPNQVVAGIRGNEPRRGGGDSNGERR